MEWWQVIGIVLGSSVLAKLIDVLATRKADQRKRKAALEDRAMDKKDLTQTLEQRFDAFCKTQSQENYELRQRLKAVESTLGALCENTAAGEYIAIRREALEGIKEGRVDAEDSVLLCERYERYKKISHKDDLDNIMDKYSKLPTKI